MSNITANKKFRNGMHKKPLFDCSDLQPFIDSIIQSLPFKGVSMSRFYICEYNGVRFLTKLCLYRKTAPEIYSKVDNKAVVPHIDAEINILEIFKRRFIDTGVTPCLIELVYSKICDGLEAVVKRFADCGKIIASYADTESDDDVKQILCKYVDLVKNGLGHNKCAFLVLDKCDISFGDYLRRGVNSPVSFAIFKSLLFQIVHVFYIIGEIYPNFRHYDLHSDNIMLKYDGNYVFSAANPKFLVFKVEGVKHIVPYFGIIPKIIDFGFSALPEEDVISNATEDKLQMFYRTQNDLLFLFNWIYYILSRYDGDRTGKVAEMLSKLEPNKTYIKYYPEHIRSIEDEIPSYKCMIKNKVWKEYKTTKITRAQIYKEYTDIHDQV